MAAEATAVRRVNLSGLPRCAEEGARLREIQDGYNSPDSNRLLLSASHLQHC